MSSQDRAPALPMYAKDWLSEPRVRHMGWAERGKYMDLLMSMWVYSDAGCEIPEGIAVGFYGAKFVQQMIDIEALYVYEKNGMNYLFHGRLSEEAQKCASRRAAAKTAVNLRWERERARRANEEG